MRTKIELKQCEKHNKEAEYKNKYCNTKIKVVYKMYITFLISIITNFFGKKVFFSVERCRKHIDF